MTGCHAVDGGTAADRSDGGSADAAFATVARIAHSEAGLVLPLDKAPMVLSRIGKRMRLVGAASLEDYCELLRREEGADERREMIFALTTNVTSFLREAHHFDRFRDAILPGLVQRARQGGRVRLWSAGCSTGQEPYSLAMTVLEAFPDAIDADLRILATDIDPHVLREARRGSYPEQLLKPLPAAWRDRYFERDRGADGDWRVTEKLRRLTAFRELNLLGRWPMTGRFDAIFCRNVVIYFDRATQSVLWSRFHAALAPGGHLFLGHSERIEATAEAPFRTAGTTIYQRMDGVPVAPAET
jgi:chemotaxis protein methyltransferase CheR